VDPAIFVYVLSAFFIFVWSWIRFTDLSAPYHEQIKLHWVVSLTYSTYYLGLFIILVVALFFSSTELIALISTEIPTKLKNFLEGSPQYIPPVFSAALLYKTHDFKLFKRLDQFALDRLLSVHHLDEDYSQLKILLSNNNFSPSKKEAAANLRLIEKFDIFVSNPPDEPPGLHSGDAITLWRKVSTLLRFSESCLGENDIDRKTEIDDLKSQHFRRTGVTLHLVRLQLSAEQIQEMDLEQNYNDVVPNSNGDERQAALIITSEQLDRSTKQLSQFFIADYKKLMEAVTAIAARLVVYSGSSAKDRLETLTESGFHGLGSFKEFTFDKITKILMLVFLGSLVTFYVLFSLLFSQFSNSIVPEETLQVSVKLAAVYAFSGLCGASFGASRRLLHRDETPWATYLIAGLSGMLVGLAANALGVLYGEWGQDLSNFPNAFGELMSKFLPFLIMPFTLAMGVAALSRKNPLLKIKIDMKEWIGDGCMLAILLLAALYVAFMLHHGMGTDLGMALLPDGEGLNYSLIMGSSTLVFILGFIVGAVVIGTARSVANSGLAVDSTT
jgi:hypothetical protein